MAKIFCILTCICIAVLGYGNGSDLALRQKVVSVAESQLHVRELTGRNDGREIEAYLRVTGLGPGHPWCAAFVSWVFQQAGVKAVRSARAADWFKPDRIVHQSNTLSSSFEFKPGMTLSFWYDNLGRIGHIAIGTGQDAHNYYTIEGNTNARGEREGQGVERKIRPKKMIYSISDHF